ncbi:hypothetical protein Hrd1104_12965 [Halorhabdus sp. CBA1104]|uniref:hypothetical protein n=1 Tax=Halorhabdus sp. CBA1104 TaxID=1380432 RepID=UPI0012B37786|nr:hypothetical protein [Halorhabdus sp. CBA1104]QGN08116.1 hypothetical protein Hrd1104_12965 [Halorhabdus sp. CBA1104]
MNRQGLMITLLLVIGVLGGCSGDLEWTISADVDDQRETAEGIQINGSVSLGGLYTDQLRIENVTVCALDQSGEWMDRATIGTFTDDRPPTNFTLTVSQQPERIVLGYGEIETDGEGAFQGLKMIEGGANQSFYQDGPRCDGS